ncbi:MAG: hypothetical protein GPJ54_02280 [Candidatus Heimdallarchaeota archaeon]|nr:hypothetical protein [Candidatus Heimdallarchaeota archaeon]
MVDAKDFEEISHSQNNVLGSKKSNQHFPVIVLSSLIVVLGTIFSRGEPTVILMSILVGGFIYLLFIVGVAIRTYIERDNRLDEIQLTLNQIIIDMQELKDKNK